VSLFKKKSSDFDEQENQGSGKSRGSLLVLLVLLGGFAYLYFFTSLIVPHEAPVATTPGVSTEVKQSMPPKPAVLPAVPAAADIKNPVEPKPAAPPVVPPAVPPSVAKPVAPVPAPQPQAAVKPAVPSPVPAAPKKEIAAPVKKAEQKAAELKPAAVPQKKAEAKSAKTPAPEKSAARKASESYTVFVGDFPAGEATAAAEAKLARLGIKPVVRQDSTKSKSMYRLFFGAYTEYDKYSAELDKLKQSAKGAFGVVKEGKYSLYAGSFSTKERGEKEKRDLAAKGITLQLQQVILPLSTVRLTAGKFAAKGEADKAAARMKREGLAVKVVPLGR